MIRGYCYIDSISIPPAMILNYILSYAYQVFYMPIQLYAVGSEPVGNVHAYDGNPNLL